MSIKYFHFAENTVSPYTFLKYNAKLIFVKEIIEIRQQNNRKIT